MTTKFGLANRNKPTPARINVLAGVFTGAIGIFIGWTGTNDIIPPKTENIVTSILGLMLLLIPVLKPLFGVEVKDDSVPANQVTAIDTDTKQ